MLMSGFPEDEATNDSRKKLLNDKVCRFHVKDCKCKKSIQVILKDLQESYEGIEHSVLERIFEDLMLL